MYERLVMTIGIMLVFAGVLFLMKRRQIAAADRASHQINNRPPVPTIVYFWSDGCPVCKLTQRRVLEGIIAEYGNEHVTLTAYNTDEAPDVAKKWGVMTLPTTFLLDPTGAIRHVNNGLALAETLRKQLEPMIKKWAGVNANHRRQ